MRINEIMDNPLPWYEIEYDPHFAIAGFEVNSKNYNVIIHVHDEQYMIANISFKLMKPGSFIGQMGQTGTGDPFSVYGTVSNILFHYVKKMGLHGVTFSGNSAKKKKLYNKLTTRLASALGWSHRVNGNTFMLFDQNNLWMLTDA